MNSGSRLSASEVASEEDRQRRTHLCARRVRRAEQRIGPATQICGSRPCRVDAPAIACPVLLRLQGDGSPDTLYAKKC